MIAGISIFFDFPAIRDAPLYQVDGIQGAENADHYNRSLGGFLDLDQEFLVRMDLNGSDPARVVRDLRLHAMEDIPHQFWRLGPWYWPKSRQPDMEAYASQHFSPERGPDGLNYFAVHDRRADRVFLWVKDNF
ncbi:hypothetical protein [Luteolibacter arcticus]|nr:hypothetical protein [Luteolibacter arcticus]